MNKKTKVVLLAAFLPTALAGFIASGQFALGREGSEKNEVAV